MNTIEDSKKKMNEKKEKKDKPIEAEEFKEILSAVSTEIPTLIKSIFSSLYSADMATEFGKSIGHLYQELRDKELPEDMIREIVLKYASSINVIGEAVKSETTKKKDEVD